MNCEKELKRFIKKSQNFSFTVATLVLFLITGMVSFGAEDVIKSNEELLKEVTKSKEEILQLLEENEKSLTTDDLAIQELVDKGKFMVKPLWDSWQFGTVVTYASMHSEDDGRGNGYDLVRRDDGKVVNEEYINGTANGSTGRFELSERDTLEGTIEVFARLQPKELPDVPSAPNVSINPSIQAPDLNIGGNIPGVEISTIDRVEVTTPTLQTPSVPSVDVETVVVSPSIPASVDPIVVEAPDVNVVVPNLPSLVIPLPSSGNGDAIYFDNPGVSNGVVESVNITDGTFNLSNSSSGYYTYNYEDYTAHTSTGAKANDTGTVSISDLSSGDKTSSGGRAAFFKLVRNNAMVLGDGVEVNINLDSSSNPSGGIYEVVHFDNHVNDLSSNNTFEGMVSNTSLALTEKQEKAARAAGDYVSNVGSLNYPTLAFINSSDINITGDPITITNNYNHRSNQLSLIVNDETGSIIMKDGDLGANNGGNIGLAVSPESGGVTSEEVIYNSGKIQIDTQQSAALYSSLNTSVGQARLDIVNDGEVSMNGYQGAGVYLYDGNNVKLNLNEPISIYGDSGIGVYVNNGVNFVNNTNAASITDATVVNVNIGMTEDDAGNIIEQVNSEGGQQVDTNANPNTNLDTIEGATGFYSGGNATQVINEYEINLASNTANSLGFATDSNSNVTLESGSINILGSGNTGMYSSDSSSQVTADSVIVKGPIHDSSGDVTNPSENNVGVYIDGGTVFSQDITNGSANFKVNNIEVNGQSNIGIVNNSSDIVGNVDMAANSGAVGLYVNGGIISDTSSTFTFTNSDTDVLSTGIFSHQNLTLANGQTITDTGTTGGVILLAGDGGNIVNSGTLDITNDSSIGVYLSGGSYSQTSTGSMVTNGYVGIDGGTGIYIDTGTAAAPNSVTLNDISAATNTLKVKNGGIALTVKGDGTVVDGTSSGIYVEGDGGTDNVAMYATERTVANNIDITTSGDNIIALYGDDNAINGATINMDGDNATGVYSGGSNGTNTSTGVINVDEDQIGMLGTTTITNEGLINSEVTGTTSGPATGGSAVGIYANNGVGVTNTGIVNATGTRGVGVYIEDGSLDNTTGDITASDSGIGVYANGASGNTIDLSNATTSTNGLNVTNEGIGLTVSGDSSSVTSTDVYIESDTTGLATGAFNIGALYSNGGVLETNNLNLIGNGDNLVLLYGDTDVDNAATLTTTGEDSILFYSGSDIGKNSGNIEVLTQNIGVAGIDTNFENTGTITVDNTGALAGSGDYSVGVLGSYDGTSTGTSTYTNSGLIEVKSNGESAIGMASIGDGTTGDTLDNSSGTINLEGEGGVAFYLQDGATLDGSKAGSVTNSDAKTGIGVVVDNTTITGDFDLSGLNGKVGVYVQNDTSGDMATYNGTVTVGDSADGNTSVGFYYDLPTSSLTGGTLANPSTISANVNTGDGGVGVYLNNETSSGVSGPSQIVNYDGTVSVGEVGDSDGGIGVYVTGDTKLVLEGGTVDLNSKGAIAFYLGEGSALDNTSAPAGSETVLNFDADGSVLMVERAKAQTDLSLFNIVDNGNAVSLGVVSEGFIDLVSSSGDPAIIIGGTKGFSALYGVVHVDGNTTIKGVADEAIALYAQGYENASSFAATGISSAAEEILNAGKLEVTGKNAVGIGLLNARAKNSGDILVGDEGFGIYANEDTALDPSDNPSVLGVEVSNVDNTGNITVGDGSIGIYQKSTTGGGYINNTGDVIGGDRSTGLYYSGTNTSLSNENLGNITLGDGGTGLVANDSVEMKHVGSIIVGNSQTYQGQEYVSAGVVATGSAKISSTGDVTVGDGGAVYYADGGSITVSSGTVTAGSDASLFYSKNGGTVDYSGSTGTFTGAKNLFVADGQDSTGTTNSTVKLTGAGAYTATLGDDGVGIFVRDGGTVDIGSSTLDITLNGVDGVGVYNDGGTVTNTITSGNISVDVKGDGGIGYYYEDASTPIYNTSTNFLTMSSNGSNRIGYLTNEVTGFTNTFDLNIGAGDGNVGFLLNGSGGAGTVYNFDNGNHTLTLGNSATTNNVGIYLNDTGTLNVTNLGTINTGVSNVAIHSAGDVVATGGGTINLGASSGGIYARGDLTTDASIIGNGSGNRSYSVFALGNLNYSGSNITVSGDNGYGLVGNSSVTTSGSGTITLSGDSGLGIFSGNTASAGITPTSSEKIINTMDIVSTGLVGTAIQGINTNIDNSGDISAGIGGTGIYGEARGNNNIEVKNSGNIVVDDSNVTVATTTNIDYSVGMGLVTDNNGVGGTGTLENTGNIEVVGNLAVGMYGSGSGSTIINSGDIIINPNAGNIDSVTGIYLINGAQGVNNGYIGTPVGTSLTTRTDVSAAVGVALYGSGTSFINNGTIDMNITNGVGVLVDPGATFTNNGTVSVSGTGSTAIQGSSSNVTTGSAGLSGPSIFANGGVLNIGTGMNLSEVTIYNTGQISTDGVVGLDGVDLILTTEANPDDIFIGSGEFVVEDGGVNIKLDAAAAIDNVNGNKTEIDLSDYTQAVIDQFVVGNGYSGNLTFSSNSLTWDYDLGTTSLTKVSYSDFVSDSNLKNFTDGLDERYVDADPDSEETKLFQSLNNIPNGDYAALDAAFDEMSGSEYANIQTRMKQVNEDFASGVDELMSWENLTKDNNKVAIIGSRRDYEIDTAGVYDYDYFSQGAMYLNSFEDLSYGQQKGYYLGFLHDEIDFDNEGESEEEGYTLMAGVFNEHSFDTEDKTSLLTKVEVFGGYRDMERKFYVYDDTYETDGDYYTYGINLINDLSYDYRVNKHFSIVPKVGFTLGYGRFTEIEEDGDVVDLEVDDNDYIVAEPSAGVDFKATMPISETMDFVASIGTEVTYDFGTREYDNEAQVRHTSADSYDLENPDEERYNLNTNARIGLEKDSFGVGAEVGYKTVGDEVYGSLDVKVKF